MHGAPVPVTYLGDLRARPEIKGALSRFYGLVFDDFKARTGCEHFYTGVLASNQRALTALTRRSPTRQDQPHYDLMRRFDSVQVQFTHAPKRARSARLTTRTARVEDLDAIIDLLHREHRLRPFGYRYDAGELERRLARWPGFDLDHTILAFDRGDRVVGACTAWDAAPLKRYRVLAYRDEMRVARVAFDLSARLRGRVLSGRRPAPSRSSSTSGWSPSPRPGRARPGSWTTSPKTSRCLGWSRWELAPRPDRRRCAGRVPARVRGRRRPGPGSCPARRRSRNRTPSPPRPRA